MGGQATLQVWRQGQGRNRALPGSTSPRAPSLDRGWTASRPVRLALPGRLPALASPRSRVKLAGSQLECQCRTGPRPSQPGLRRLTTELPGCEAPCSELVRTNPGELGRVYPPGPGAVPQRPPPPGSWLPGQPRSDTGPASWPAFLGPVAAPLEGDSRNRAWARSGAISRPARPQAPVWRLLSGAGWLRVAGLPELTALRLGNN